MLKQIPVNMLTVDRFLADKTCGGLQWTASVACEAAVKPYPCWPVATLQTKLMYNIVKETYHFIALLQVGGLLWQP